MSSIASRRFAFDGGLVLRDGESGRVWLLQDAAAEACRGLDNVEAVAALSSLHQTSDDSASLIGRLWSPPEESAELDLVLRDGGPVVRVRVWDRRLAVPLASMLTSLAAVGEPSVVLDLFVAGDRTAVARDGLVVQDGPGIGWWFLVRWLSRSLHAGRSWLGVLHAATVVPPGGDAVAIAGVSGAGKTTLAGAMIAAGARLLSDDATPIEAGSRLAWPCPLAMGVKKGSWPLFTAMFDDFADVTPVHFGTLAIRYFPAPRMVRGEGRPVAAIVFPAWKSGAALTPERLRPRDALCLLAQSGTEPSVQEEHLADMLQWLETVPAWRLGYGDLGEAVSFVRGLASGGQDEAT
ncbi:MAG: hypothetical protein ACOYJQ_09365 [Pseudochelatococcus sp.]|jgi:hypothetical protein|uniref:hypothetical protein n=1 Tax=Pseudochelatococcus sp. TaxID=2020869 RepID=UPI003D8A76BA